MMIGQIEVMKITNIAEGCESRKPASDSGSQASGGTVRSTWKIGPGRASPRCSGRPARPARCRPPRQAEADGDAAEALRICQKAPLSTPPLS